MSDDTDAEPSKAELISKVEQLESEQQTLKSQLKRMLPSRRDALKAGAAASVGIGALGVASDTAESATGSAGTIGSASSRPDIFADEIDTTTLTIGGGLFELDQTVSISGQVNATISINTPSDHIIILPNTTKNFVGYGSMRVNGDSGSNYDIIDRSGTQTTGRREFTGFARGFQRPRLELMDGIGGRVNLAVQNADVDASSTVGGENKNISGPITQIEFRDVQRRSTELSVFRRRL